MIFLAASAHIWASIEIKLQKAKSLGFFLESRFPSLIVNLEKLTGAINEL
jgi:hypothetical protein